LSSRSEAEGPKLTMKKFFSSYPISFSSGLVICRIILGSFLIYHGWEFFDSVKMQEYQQWDAFTSSSGKFLVYAGKGAELLAGFMFVFGFLTRIASLLTIGTMLYIAFLLGNGKVFSNDQHPALFVLISLLFIFTGPGKYSLDHLIFDKNKSLRP
jgi:putative oxidoreductase